MTLRLATIDGEIRRDEGMARALAAEKAAWRQAWFEIVYYAPIGWEGLGEDLKHICLEWGLTQPRKYGSWGAMISGAVKRGMLIEKYPLEIRKPSDPRSHASQKRVWRRTGLV